MSQFGRAFDERGLDALENALIHWWRDLLMLWRPSGQPTGDEGLRLAIRNGYMNFCRRGQSIARVSLDRQKQPILKVHAKYVSPKLYDHVTDGQEYVTLKSNSIVRPFGRPALQYEGIETLKRWVQTVDRGHADVEKSLVDDLLAIKKNGGVIDLEMGLPAWGDVKSAKRIDLVSINRVGSQLMVFLGEVKRISDDRLRCRGPIKQDDTALVPKILVQLRHYQNYLAKSGHRKLVGEQYANAARLLKRLRKMAHASPDALRAFAHSMRPQWLVPIHGIAWDSDAEGFPPVRRLIDGEPMTI